VFRTRPFRHAFPMSAARWSILRSRKLSLDSMRAKLRCRGTALQWDSPCTSFTSPLRIKGRPRRLSSTCSVRPSNRAARTTSRTESLYVALILTLLQPPPNAGWRSVRGALLRLWAESHNAVHTRARFEYWANEDLPVYRSSIEGLFLRSLSGRLELDLVAPIAVLWKNAGPANGALRAMLSDWLTLVFPAVDPKETPEEARERASFRVAGSSRQLRLSSVGISVLSVRPVIEMLRPLALSARSCAFCYERRTLNSSEVRIPTKSLDANFTFLLRWSFSDSAPPRSRTARGLERHRSLASPWGEDPGRMFRIRVATADFEPPETVSARALQSNLGRGTCRTVQDVAFG
jgi:hypothetical protein